MSEFEEKVKAAAESAKNTLGEVAEAAKGEFDNVVSEGKEVAEEMKAAASGEKLTSDVEGAAGYRADDKKNSPLAIAALVLGILSIVFAFAQVYVGVILGIVGVVLAAKARKEAQTSMATAGFVCSIIGLALSAVMLVCALVCVGSLAALGAIT